MARPTRGDVVAGVSVALVLVPQAMAYATIAGLEPVHGLYAAAVAPLAGALVGSSPYLQTGPVAVTSLLTFGALSAIAEPFTTRFALLAAVLALFVGVIRLVVGLVRGGSVAYLMSQPVVVSFTTAAALLIIGSQVPAALGVEGQSDNPVLASAIALAAPSAWSLVDVALAVGAIGVMLGGRRIVPAFPGALVAVVAATTWSTLSGYKGAVVGDISLRLVPPSSVPLADLGALLLPAVVIAFIGFAEPASIARRYAVEDRRPWNPHREFIGQGLANLAAGGAGGLPVGGSFSRTALNRLSGARTRWSGAITGLAVLLLLPVASLLEALPTAVLAGLVIAAAVTLVDPRQLLVYWRWSKPQTVVVLVTFLATLSLAPRVERGVLLGIAATLSVHLWREMSVDVPYRLEQDTLHLRPSGVLYFGSAPAVERTLNRIIAAHDEVRRVVIHLDRTGRVDLTGAVMLKDVVEGASATGDVTVVVAGAPEHARSLLLRVLGPHVVLGTTPSGH